MPTLVIDGIDLPEPTSLRLPEFDLDSENTGRNEDGVAQRDRIRKGVLKAEVEYKWITASELMTIKKAIEPAKINVVFREEFLLEPKDMYAGDRMIELASYKNSNSNNLRWNISFNLVEY